MAVTEGKFPRDAQRGPKAMPGRSAAPPPRAPEPRDDEIDLRELIAMLMDEWRWIVGITLAVTMLAALYAVTATPIYRSNVLLQVEQKEGGLSGIEELSTVLTGETPTEAEIEIIRSRSVLLETIDDLNLHTRVSPRHFPVFGGAMARSHDGEGLAEPWSGFDSYAWGGERIQVDRLTVPRYLEGEPLTLVALGGGRYSLRDPDGGELLQAAVGEAASWNGSGLFVAELVARPGTEFELVRYNTLATLDTLNDMLSVTERGKKTGILELSLEGEDPEEVAAVLDSISSIYLRQNVERKSAEAAQTIEFLSQQLPELKDNLDAAETQLNAYRVERGTVDLSLETQGLLEQLAGIESQLSEVELRRAELAQRYTPEHPVIVALNDQQSELQRTRDLLETEIRTLPESEQDSLRLMRDVRVANELYMLLLNRSQELKVVQAGTVGNVRIVDEAFVPVRPVKPKKPLTVALGLVLGGMLGLFVVFVRRVMDVAIHDPKELESLTELPVYATVPHSPDEHAFATSEETQGQRRLLADRSPHDPAIESLRSLRTSLEFLFMETGRQVLTIGGPAPGVGKSFTSANLAALMAQVDRRILLIDGDLRRGHLHQVFGQQRGPGLADLITGNISRDEAIRETEHSNLYFLATGTLPPNPGELLISTRFEQVLDGLIADFDAVVIDAPPVLAAAEAVALARNAAVNLLVVRSGCQNRREVEMAVQRLEQGGAMPRGFVFNDLRADSRRYAYYGYGQYGYDYKPGGAD